ncbi:hypothetical protein Bpfe_001620 [Biomphalaria pfeifferi]|uniref:Uncharacterized protein n=1 Tax=Biomphalaria pfeifferi TaxID=112525 RepID=A0AAD8FKT1_BIOPF|nr:hypothetical protein Bpfe_001620 [Biomphalaria pfeifferi]
MMNYETEDLKRLQGTYPVVTSYMSWNNTFKFQLVSNYEEYENILWKSMTCLNTKENNVSSVCQIDLCKEQVWKTEKVNMWNDTEVVYNPRFEKVFYVTRYIVLSDDIINIKGNNEEMPFHFTLYAKLISSLSGIKAGTATDDLQQPPGLRSIGSLILEDLENMYLVHHYFTVPTINILNGTKRQFVLIFIQSLHTYVYHTWIRSAFTYQRMATWQM